jgi:hypothetical protein
LDTGCRRSKSCWRSDCKSSSQRRISAHGKTLASAIFHRNVSLFQIMLQTPLDGTTVFDDLDSRFVKAEKLVRSGVPSLHKQGGEVIREAAERFCKEILLRSRRANGEAAASLND